MTSTSVKAAIAGAHGGNVVVLRCSYHTASEVFRTNDWMLIVLQLPKRQYFAEFSAPSLPLNPAMMEPHDDHKSIRRQGTIKKTLAERRM